MDSKLLFFVLVFFLVFGTFGVALLFDQDTSGLSTRARQQCEPVAETSFLTSFPKTVEPGQPCEVNVFARCEDESAVVGANVSLEVVGGFPDPDTTLTDESGRAVFTVEPQGLANISAVINGALRLPMTVTCGIE